MKSIQTTAALIAATTIQLHAKDTTVIEPAHISSASCQCHHSKLPAPIGVMGDHMHKEGQLMFSYRAMYMNMDGYREGTNKLTNSDVFAKGFRMSATQMEMEMHMLGVMYAPSDHFTLMAMTGYVFKDMDMTMMNGMTRSTSTEGWGDTSITALVKLYDSGTSRILLNFGIGLPTAKVDEKNGMMYQNYGMQLGRGTWDSILGITYAGTLGKYAYGVQAKAIMTLEDANSSGFAWGDKFSATTWLTRSLSPSLSASARLSYTYQDAIDGGYTSDAPMPMMSPMAGTANYGGHVLEAGLGLSYKFADGMLKGHSLSLEALTPIYQKNNGIGMNRDFSVTFGWRKAF